MEVLSQLPHTVPFIPLAEHQSTTPASFHDGPPVLYYHGRNSQVVILEEELQNAPALSNMVRKIATLEETTGDTAAEGTNGTHSKRVALKEIDIWVTSEKFLIYSSAHETGVSIPYPTILLHAIQSLPTPSDDEVSSQGLYMQLLPAIPSSNDEEPPDTISLTIIPAEATPAPANAEHDELTTEEEGERRPVMALFKALSDCSNLHPDPVDSDDEDGSRLMHAGLALPGTSDGSLPPPMPGSGGWITAENMHEFIDADGNFIDDNEDNMDEDTEELGPGAGTVRSQPPDTDGDTNQDSKWRRTS